MGPPSPLRIVGTRQPLGTPDRGRNSSTARAHTPDKSILKLVQLKLISIASFNYSFSNDSTQNRVKFGVESILFNSQKKNIFSAYV